MKALLILNDPPYGSERCYNALRLAEDGELVQGAHRGTMEQLASWTQWADKVLVF